MTSSCPHGARVTDVLSVLGIASRANPHAIATPSGRVLGPHDSFDESVPTGSILSVVPVTTHAVTRDILNLDRGRSAGGARTSAPAGSGGRHRDAPEPPPSRSEVDESTRRRGEPAPAEVSEVTGPRSALTDGARGPPRTRARPRSPSTASQLIWLSAAFGAVISLVAGWSLAAASDADAGGFTVWGVPSAWMPAVAAGAPRRRRHRAGRAEQRPGRTGSPRPRPRRPSGSPPA